MGGNLKPTQLPLSRVGGDEHKEVAGFPSASCSDAKSEVIGLAYGFDYKPAELCEIWDEVLDADWEAHIRGSHALWLVDLREQFECVEIDSRSDGWFYLVGVEKNPGPRPKKWKPVVKPAPGLYASKQFPGMFWKKKPAPHSAPLHREEKYPDGCEHASEPQIGKPVVVAPAKVHYKMGSRQNKKGNLMAASVANSISEKLGALDAAKEKVNDQIEAQKLSPCGEKSKSSDGSSEIEESHFVEWTLPEYDVRDNKLIWVCWFIVCFVGWIYSPHLRLFLFLNPFTIGKALQLIDSEESVVGVTNVSSELEFAKRTLEGKWIFGSIRWVRWMRLYLTGELVVVRRYNGRMSFSVKQDLDNRIVTNSVCRLSDRILRFESFSQEDCLTGEFKVFLLERSLMEAVLHNAYQNPQNVERDCVRWVNGVSSVNIPSRFSPSVLAGTTLIVRVKTDLYLLASKPIRDFRFYPIMFCGVLVIGLMMWPYLLSLHNLVLSCLCGIRHLLHENLSKSALAQLYGVVLHVSRMFWNLGR